MDYEVLMPSEFMKSGNNQDNTMGCSNGLQNRSMIKGAAIMVVVFMAFGLSSSNLKQIGFGLALAFCWMLP